MSAYLGQRVGDVEHLLVDRKDPLFGLEGESSLSDVVVSGVNAHGDLALGKRRSVRGLDVPLMKWEDVSESAEKGGEGRSSLEVSVGPGDEVGRDLGSLVEVGDLPVVLELARRDELLAAALSFSLGLSLRLALRLSLSLALRFSLHLSLSLSFGGNSLLEERLSQQLRPGELSARTEVRSGGDDVRVGERDGAGAGDEGDGVGGFEEGFVEAGEGAAGLVEELSRGRGRDGEREGKRRN